MPIGQPKSLRPIEVMLYFINAKDRTDAMKAVKEIKTLIVIYVALMVFLLTVIAATPFLIRHSLAISSHLVIQEEFLETALILAIFGLSYLILKAYQRSLDAYRSAVDRAGKEKSKLASRLVEAFNYIGSVNVGIKEIQSVVCGCDHYPQTRKEFNQFLQGLTAKVMSATGASWIVVRIIDLRRGRTIKEFTTRGRGIIVPSATIGNRVLMEGGLVEDYRAIGVRQKNPDMLTTCIFKAIPLSEEQIVLVTAAAKEIEMAFMLYRAGGRNKQLLTPKEQTEKEICHDTYH
jgi:hypothetical protein